MSPVPPITTIFMIATSIFRVPPCVSLCQARNTQPFILGERLKDSILVTLPRRRPLQIGEVQLWAQQIPRYHNPNRQQAPEITHTTGLSMFFSPGKWMCYLHGEIPLVE